MSLLTTLLDESFRDAKTNAETPIFDALVTDTFSAVTADRSRGRHHLSPTLSLDEPMRSQTPWRPFPADTLERLIASAAPLDGAAVPSPRGTYARPESLRAGRHRLAATSSY